MMNHIRVHDHRPNLVQPFVPSVFRYKRVDNVDVFVENQRPSHFSRESFQDRDVVVFLGKVGFKVDLVNIVISRLIQKKNKLVR